MAGKPVFDWVTLLRILPTTYYYDNIDIPLFFDVDPLLGTPKNIFRQKKIISQYSVEGFVHPIIVLVGQNGRKQILTSGGFVSKFMNHMDIIIELCC